jgi:prenyltransferase beta subunit
MPFREQIGKACGILISHQNEDGGIPGTSFGVASVAWDTADALEAFLLSSGFTKLGLLRIHRMVEFLLHSQICPGGPSIRFRDEVSPKSPELGGWPWLRTARACTMATGHAIAALRLSQSLFNEDANLSQRLKLATQYGVLWLEKNQNEDGGWGVEPNSVGEASASRVVATYYALHGLWTVGEIFPSAVVVRKAVNYLLSVRNDDGSWGYANGIAGDVSNTARAVTALIRSGYWLPSSPEVQAGIGFLRRRCDSSGALWNISQEGYAHLDATDHVVYSNNSVCDSLVCMLTANYFGREAVQSLHWLLNSQQSNGVWHLSSPGETRRDISTWSTAEWVQVIDLAQVSYVGHIVHSRREGTRNGERLLALILFAIAISETAFLLLSHAAFRVRLVELWQRSGQLGGLAVVLAVTCAILFLFFAVGRRYAGR